LKSAMPSFFSLGSISSSPPSVYFYFLLYRLALDLLV
jgi:hypothetical protein